jgi:hypothetical protein
VKRNEITKKKKIKPYVRLFENKFGNLKNPGPPGPIAGSKNISEFL